MLTTAAQSFDVFHVFLNTRHSQLLDTSSAIKPRTEDDWDTEDVPDASGLLSVVTPQQRASPVVICELSRMCGWKPDQYGRHI